MFFIVHIVMKQIDWYEPWLWFLIAFHLLCMTATVVTVMFNHHNTQIVLFLVFCEFALPLLHLNLMLDM